METYIDVLTQWLRHQVDESGLQGILVGISGGIDSAVVAHLLAKALPGRSLGVILPCKSDETDEMDAMSIVETSGIDHITIDLSEAHTAMFSNIEETLKAKQTWQSETARLDDGNLRARLRMSTLYAVAAQYKYLVAGTDNIAEWYTGYFTKYGDGGVDIVPLIHLLKGEVSDMARDLGVAEQVIAKKPSAGLWEGQTDENEMGTTYQQIDRYLQGYTVPETDRKVIEHLHQTSDHKRHLAKQPPEPTTH